MYSAYSTTISLVTKVYSVLDRWLNVLLCMQSIIKHMYRIVAFYNEFSLNHMNGIIAFYNEFSLNLWIIFHNELKVY